VGYIACMKKRGNGHHSFFFLQNLKSVGNEHNDGRIILNRIMWVCRLKFSGLEASACIVVFGVPQKDLFLESREF
jgi:hypothetical protein